MRIQVDKERMEIDIMHRKPYFDLRLGLTQCALWVGDYKPVFNFFPNLTGRAS